MSAGLLVRLVDHLVDRDGRHEAPVTYDAAEPVLDEAEQRAKAGAVITQLVGLAVATGLVTAGHAPVLIGVLVVLAAVVIAIGHAVLVVRRAYAVRAQVTPWAVPPVQTGDVVEGVADGVVLEPPPSTAIW